MTINEMSQEFDILYNQVNSNNASALDEYEKSIFLTRAQDELVKAYFDPRANKVVRGFDDGQKRQYDFSKLIANKILHPILPNDTLPSQGDDLSTQWKFDDVVKYDPRSYMYFLPNDVFLTLNESVVETVPITIHPSSLSYSVFNDFDGMTPVTPQDTDGENDENDETIGRIIEDEGDSSTTEVQRMETYIYQVIPITYEEYQILMQKPYQYPPKRQVWRIITDQNIGRTGGAISNFSACVEIIGRFLGTYQYNNVGVHPVYKMRYVQKPTPIILVNLDTTYNGLTIDGFHGNPEITGEASIAIADVSQGYGIPCYLPEGVHHEIIQRAVELASAVYNVQAVNPITGIGNASATDIGITGAGRQEAAQQQRRQNNYQ